MPQLRSQPLEQYKNWAQAPTGVPTLDALLAPTLSPQAGIGASPVGMVGDKAGPLAALLRRVFHGSGEAFDQFSPDMTRHPGYWFSTSPKEAGMYASGPAPNIRPASLNMKNPGGPSDYSRAIQAVEQEASGAGRSLSRSDMHTGVGAKLSDLGFDGVQVPGVGGASQFAVFDPSRILDILAKGQQ